MLVLIVILVFLQDWRATLVPATTVPVTIIGAFAAMAALGFTVNLSTLFAIVLAIGIVVDDAIVVVEGAAHHMERGLSAHDAAIKAMDELFGPIIGITLVLMAVFMPAAFLPGLTGQMYAQFALVIAATALISAINAATLKPTQCALWLRPPVPPEKRNFFFRGFNLSMTPLEHGYARLIGRMVHHAPADGADRADRWRSSAFWGIARLPTGVHSDRGSGLLWSRHCSFPTARRWNARRRRWRRSPRSRAPRPAWTRWSRSPASPRWTTTPPSSSAGADYVILKDWSARKDEGRGPALDLPRICKARWTACRMRPRSLLVPPPIQGIGNASGFTMMIEQLRRQRRLDQAGPRHPDGALPMLPPERAAASWARHSVPTCRRSRWRWTAPRRKRCTCRSATCSTRCPAISVRATSTSSTSFGRTFQVYVQADSRFRLHADDLEALYVRSNSGQHGAAGRAGAPCGQTPGRR